MGLGCSRVTVTEDMQRNVHYEAKNDPNENFSNINWIVPSYIGLRCLKVLNNLSSLASPSTRITPQPRKISIKALASSLSFQTRSLINKSK